MRFSMHNDRTRVYAALYKKESVFGTPTKYFACEIMISAIIIFVLKIYFLIIFILLSHIVVALINKREPEFLNIILFLLSLGGEDSAKLP